MEKNKISVILPVYNGGRFVGKSIESVLNQSYKNIELIIVNDCSTDNTQEVISDYATKDDRIKIYNNAINRKLPGTLNNGFTHATGEYLTWTSDDNTYHLDALEKMARVLDNNSKIELVYADFSICDMDGNLIKEVKEGAPEEIRYRDNIGACFLYRNTLAAKVGKYDEETFLAEDYDFFIRCYREANGNFYHISEDLYDYGRHDANLTATRQKDIAHKAFDVMMKHFDFLYSQCKNNEDKYRFFDELLALLGNKEENKKQREVFYSISGEYKKYDVKRIRKQRMYSAIAMPRRVVKKLFS